MHDISATADYDDNDDNENKLRMNRLKSNSASSKCDSYVGLEVVHDNVVSSDKWRWSILVFSFSFYFGCVLSWNESSTWSENQSKTSDWKCFRTIKIREKLCVKN